ncbi:hypothetical protein Tco_1367436 [Tanacetum coccineum]
MYSRWASIVGTTSPEYIPGPEDPLTPLVPQESLYLLLHSPTAESPGYVTESDLEEDPEEYEDDETEDGPVDYPVDWEMMEMMISAIHLGMTANNVDEDEEDERGRGGGGALALADS